VEIRRSLGVQAQDRLSFTPMPDGTVVLRAKNKTLADLKGLLKPPLDQVVSLDEMNLGQG